MMWQNSRYLGWLLGFEAQRKRLWHRAPPGALKQFLAVPFPSIDTLLLNTAILSVDFETTGLNAQQDQLLSVGFVTLQNHQIELSSAYHQVIKTQGKLQPHNVVIHQITDDIKDQGLGLSTVVEALLAALAGKVMLAHFSRIEQQFLAKACIELYGMAPIYPIIDTLSLAKKRLDRRGISYVPAALSLSALRDTYQLPGHYGHNALNDAIATAEWLQAEIAHQPHPQTLRLADFLL